MSKEDLYLILQVGRAATVNDIKRAFRKLARRYHPDINPGDSAAEEFFKRISEAYEILSDPQKKQFYDQNGFYSDGVLETSTSKKSWEFTFEGFDFSTSGSTSFSEMYSGFMSRRAAHREAEQGHDLEYQMALTFQESMRGLKSRITVYRKQPCAVCAGDGRSPTVRAVLCTSCQGSGTVERRKGHLRFAMPCGACNGSGRLSALCEACGGDGRVSVTENIEIDLPAGVSTGSRVRYPAKGDIGRLGGSPGDLYIVTNVSPHPFFRRAGDNIQCTVPITFWEAALGSKIEVPTVDGSAIIRIPPGTQSGSVFRMRNRGAPSLIQPGLRGDQFVEVKVAVPQIADERSKDILRELARLNPVDPRNGLPKG